MFGEPVVTAEMADLNYRLNKVISLYGSVMTLLSPLCHASEFCSRFPLCRSGQVPH